MEKADDFLRSAYEGYVTKAQKIVEDEASLETTFKDFKDDFDRFKEDSDMVTEKIEGKLEVMKKDQDKAAELIKQLESVSNDNADTVNGFMIKVDDRFDHLQNEAKDLADTMDHKLADLDRNQNEISSRMDKTEAKVKDNVERIDDLDEQRKKVRQDLDDLKDKLEARTKALEIQMNIVENDINGNLQKIEEANKVIKRHTEQILPLDSDLNDLKQDLEAVKDMAEHLDDMVKKHQEKLVNFEEHTMIQQEKAKHVEALNERLVRLDEAKQQSEAKVKEEVEERIKENHVQLEALKRELEGRINDILHKSNNNDHDIHEIKGDLDNLQKSVNILGREKEQLVDEVDHVTSDNKTRFEQLLDRLEQVEIKAKNECKNNKDAIDDVEDELKDIKSKLKDSVKDEIEDLSKLVQDKLNDVDKETKINAGHVDNLREVNKELLERIKINVQDDIDKNKENLKESAKAIENIEVKLDELKSNLHDLKAKEVEVLVVAKEAIEDKIKELEDKTEHLEESLKNDHDHINLIIRESKESHEKMLKELNEKLVVVEKDNEDIQMIKETIDSLEDKYSKAKHDQGNLEAEIRVIDERHQRNIDDIDHRRGSDAQFTMEKIKKIGTSIFIATSILKKKSSIRFLKSWWESRLFFTVFQSLLEHLFFIFPCTSSNASQRKVEIVICFTKYFLLPLDGAFASKANFAKLCGFLLNGQIKIQGKKSLFAMIRQKTFIREKDVFVAILSDRQQKEPLTFL